MPKIDAPTVAEHRARREKAIIGAAVGILVTEGGTAVTPGAVAKEAGLARTSVYQYFPSTGALLGAAIEALAQERAVRLRSAVAEVDGPPLDRLRAYVRTRVQLEDGSALPDVDLTAVPGDVRERLDAATARSREPLHDALVDLGVPDVTACEELVDGVLVAACALVRAGTSPHDAADLTERFTCAGVSSAMG